MPPRWERMRRFTSPRLLLEPFAGFRSGCPPRGPTEVVQKAIDALECHFDLVQAGGVGAADVPGAARAKGLPRNDGNPRLIEQPGREVVRGEAGRGDRGERVERASWKMTVQSEIGRASCRERV